MNILYKIFIFEDHYEVKALHSDFELMCPKRKDTLKILLHMCRDMLEGVYDEKGVKLSEQHIKELSV